MYIYMGLGVVPLASMSNMPSHKVLNIKIKSKSLEHCNILNLKESRINIIHHLRLRRDLETGPFLTHAKKSIH